MPPGAVVVEGRGCCETGSFFLCGVRGISRRLLFSFLSQKCLEEADVGCNLGLLLVVTASLSSLDESLLLSQLPAVVRVVAGSDTIELMVLTAADIELLPAAETLVTSSDVIREPSESGGGERRFSGNLKKKLNRIGVQT